MFWDSAQSKLKQQSKWSEVDTTQDAIALISMIKSITFKSEDQSFLPLALYKAKLALYNFQQHNMSCQDYLERFTNLADIATAYNGQLFDRAIVDIITEQAFPGVRYETLNISTRFDMDQAANKLYLSTMFLARSDRKRYSRLTEDLANNFTQVMMTTQLIW